MDDPARGHSPRYGLKWYALYTTSDSAYFHRDSICACCWPAAGHHARGRGRLAVSAAGLASWVALAVVVNASGAGGDLWMAAITRRCDPAALIRDEADGMRVYLPAATPS